MDAYTALRNKAAPSVMGQSKKRTRFEFSIGPEIYLLPFCRLLILDARLGSVLMYNELFDNRISTSVNRQRVVGRVVGLTALPVRANATDAMNFGT
jgi:hypothetical protein